MEFTIQGQTTVVEHSPGDSLLESALRNELNPPYSCLEGVCQTCLARLEEGQVDIPTEEGMILTCQAKPAKDCSFLKINYDH